MKDYQKLIRIIVSILIAFAPVIIWHIIPAVWKKTTKRYTAYRMERQYASHTKTIDGVRYFLYNDTKTAKVAPLKKRYKRFDIGTGGMYVATKYYKGHITVKDTITYLYRKYPVTEVADEAFNGCKELESVQLPNTIRIIGEQAFSCDKKLHSINWPDSLKRIKKYAFSECESLQAVEIYGDCTIEQQVFFLCKSLETFIMKREQVMRPNPENESKPLANLQKTIGEGAFCDCPRLKHVEIHALNATMQSNTTNFWSSTYHPVFSYCDSLQEIYISDSCRNLCYYNGAIYNKDTTTLIFCLPSAKGDFYVPTSVRKIRTHAFMGCKQLTEIWLHKDIRYIETWAFTDSCTVLFPNVRMDNLKLSNAAFNDKQTIVYY